MKNFKKFLMVLFVILMLSPLSLEAFAIDTVSSDTIKVEVTTDKSSYKPWQVAKITATVTNTGSEDLNNVIAQAVFDDLAPAGKSKSYTSKKVDVLKAGESISFTYKATLDADEHNLNIFEQIILWLVRLFNGGYTAQTADINAITQSSTEIKFGKYFAKNVIEVGYEEEVIDNDSFRFTDFYADFYDIYINKTEQVTFTAEVETTLNISNNSISVFDNANNFVCYLNPTDKSGTFEGTVSLSKDSPQNIEYYAKYYNLKSDKFEICFYRDITKEEYSDFLDLQSAIQQKEKELKFLGCSNIEIVNNIYNYLKSIEFVEDVKLEENNISFKTSFGVTGIYSISNGDCLSGNSSISSEMDNRSQTERSVISNGMEYRPLISNTNILFICPYGANDTNFNYDGYNAVLELLSQYIGGNVTTLWEEEASIEALKNIDDFGMVFFYSHGALANNNPFTMVGEVSSLDDTAYSSDFSASRICVDMSTGRLAIGGKFYKKYYEKGDFDNTYFHLGSCYSLKNNSLANALISRGCEVVLGYSNKVFFNNDYVHMYHMIAYLLEGKTVEESRILTEETEKVQEFSQEDCEFRYRGNKNYKLVSVKKLNLTGTVIDSITNEAPTSLPVVKILDSNNVVVAYTSVRDGSFSLCVPAGEYTLSIECEGYNTYTAPLTIDSAQSIIDLGTIELEPVSSGGTDYSNIAVGDTITLGTYNGEPITWVCVDIDANGPLMLSEDVLCTKEYDAPGTSSTYHTDGWGYIRENYGSNCWYDSNIRQWLNSNESSVSWTHCPPSYSAEAGFMTNFTASELSLVKPVERLVNVVAYESKRSGYCEGGSKDTVVNEIYNSSFPATNYYYDYIEDSFFLLSAVQFNNIYIKNPNYLNASSKYSTCITSGNNSSCFEWVGTVEPNSTTLDISSNAWITYGIRPAFYLALNIERPSNVPEEAVYFNGHYYKTYETGTTWTDAKAYCESLGGHLATITSQEENTFISTITPNNYYFTGATDKEEEGKWQWVTGESWQYSNWDSGEPNNGLTGTSQNYLAILGQSEPDGGCWDDSWDYPGDAHSFGFICEWES